LNRDGFRRHDCKASYKVPDFCPEYPVPGLQFIQEHFVPGSLIRLFPEQVKNHHRISRRRGFGYHRNTFSGYHGHTAHAQDPSDGAGNIIFVRKHLQPAAGVTVQSGM
jgi:hypothetical protein